MYTISGFYHVLDVVVEKSAVASMCCWRGSGRSCSVVVVAFLESGRIDSAAAVAVTTGTRHRELRASEK